MPRSKKTKKIYSDARNNLEIVKAQICHELLYLELSDCHPFNLGLSLKINLNPMGNMQTVGFQLFLQKILVKYLTRGF